MMASLASRSVLRLEKVGTSYLLGSFLHHLKAQRIHVSLHDAIFPGVRLGLGVVAGM